MQEGKPALPDALRPARNFPPLKPLSAGYLGSFQSALDEKEPEPRKTVKRRQRPIFTLFADAELKPYKINMLQQRKVSGASQ